MHVTYKWQCWVEGVRIHWFVHSAAFLLTLQFTQIHDFQHQKIHHRIRCQSSLPQSQLITNTNRWKTIPITVYNYHTWILTVCAPLPLTTSFSSKSKLVLPFWYRLTWVVPDKGPLNGCHCCCSADATVTPSSLTSLKSRMAYLSGAGLPRLS